MATSQIFVLMTIAIVSAMAHERTVMLDSLGGDVVLDCIDSGGMVDDFMAWLLPTNTTIGLNFTNYYLEVQNGGAQLAMHEVSVANIGQYMCLGQNMTTYGTVNVEMSQPNLSEYYKNNIIVGVCATLIAAVFLAGIWLTYHFRWRDDKTETSYTMADPDLSRSRVEYVNTSYDGEPVPIKASISESRM